MTGEGQMSTAGLRRLAGLVSVAAGVLLVVTQLVGALAFVVVDADPVRAGSALVGANSLLALLAVYLLVGLVGLYARQSAASGTLGLVGFLVAVLGTMLLAGAWWWEALAVPYAAAKAPALVAESPTGTALAGAVVSFGASPWAGCCSGSPACERGASRVTPPSCWSSIGGVSAC
jgi:hypothetical protein